MSGPVAPSEGIDQTGMRRVNTASVLRAFLAQSEPLTSADLVEATGLSRRTLELIVAALQHAGWVTEVDSPDGAAGRGRPRKYFALVSTRAVVVAVHFDEFRVHTVVADIRGEEVARAEEPTARFDDPAATLAQAVEVARGTLRSARVGTESVRAIVLSLGGRISDEGVMVTPAVVEAWAGVDLCAPFREAFEVPVIAENDTNLSALAEHWTGAADGTETFVYLIPGARLSASLFLGGSIHRGFEGSAGELIRIRGVDIARWREHPLGGVSSPEEVEQRAAQEILDQAMAGDADALANVRGFLAGIAALLSVIGWLLAPPLVVVAGRFDEAEAEVLEILREELVAVGAPHFGVRTARFVGSGGLIGAVRLALDVAEREIFDLRNMP
ncbi:ROK family transcriptional regulator [Microbacterium sediminicola]|uniref:ROK family transcriptional regulator n=1 Tax=Microbacterium sediminicola TaxID=415210 RepID=A0ABN2HGR7_9MICO